MLHHQSPSGINTGKKGCPLPFAVLHRVALRCNQWHENLVAPSIVCLMISRISLHSCCRSTTQACSSSSSKRQILLSSLSLLALSGVNPPAQAASYGKYAGDVCWGGVRAERQAHFSTLTRQPPSTPHPSIAVQELCINQPSEAGADECRRKQLA